MKKQKNFKQRGITLVALVVTIIILLILAGITISQLTGSGLFENARLAEEKSKNAQEKEDGILEDYENKIGQYVEGSRDGVILTEEQWQTIQKEISTLKSNGDIHYKITGSTTVASGVGKYAEVYINDKITIPDGYEIFQVTAMPKYVENYSAIIGAVKIGSSGEYIVSFKNTGENQITFDYQINVTLVKTNNIK